MKNGLIKVNKNVWEDDIRREINEWKEYSESCFCNTKRYKESALQTIERLHGMLETLLQKDGLTGEQIQWFLHLVW